MNQQLFISLSTNIDKSTNAISNINAQITELSAKLKEINLQVALDIADDSITNLNTKIQQLESKIEPIKVNVEYDSSAMSNVDGMNNINEGYVKGALGAVELTQATDEANSGIKVFNNSLKEQNSLFKDSKYSLDTAMQSFLTYQVVTEIFYHAKQAIASMINEIVELDAAMVELSKVTDLTDVQMQEFLDDAYEGAERVAKTGTEMVEAATEFAKAGYDSSDAQMLGEVALMYTNIADEAISASEASEFIIAQMKAFNITAEESIHIIDAVNEVSNNFAVSSADIANNLGKSSAVMANAGNSYEQMIGLLTAGTEITRSAAKVSNGLKTITLRLQGMTDEGEESLELVAQMEELYDKLGISVYKADGSLKNTYELLESLAPVYQDATAELKAYITETIAGKYQAQNAAAILSNFGTAIEATGTAVDSTGSAMEENEKAIDSIAGHINKLKSSWEEMSNAFMNSDMLKIVLDFANILVSFVGSPLSTFIIKIGLMVAAMRGGIAIFTLLGNSFSKISESLKVMNAVITITNSKKDLLLARSKLLQAQQNYEKMSLAELTAVLHASGIQVEGLTKKKQAQELINKALTSSTMLLNIALSASTLLITMAVSAYQKYKQAKEDAAQAALDEARNLATENDSLNDSISQIKELSAVMSSSTSTYEDASQARTDLEAVQNSLIEKFGLEADGLNLVTGAIEEQIVKLRELEQQSAKDYLSEHKNAYDDAVKMDTEENSRIGSLADVEHMWGGGAWGQVDLMTDFAKDFGLNADGAKGLGGGEIRIDDASASELYDFWSNLATHVRENSDELKDAYDLTDAHLDEILNDASSKVSHFKDKLGDTEEIIAEYNNQELMASGYGFLQDDLQGLAQETSLNEDNVQSLIDNYSGLDEALKNNGITITDLIDSYQDVPSLIEGVTESIGDDGLLHAMKDLADAEEITIEQVEGLTDKYPSLAIALEDVGVSSEDFLEYLKSMTPELIIATETTEALQDSLSGLVGELDSVNDALLEYKENGEISVSTALELIEAGYASALAFDAETGAVRLDTAAMEALARARIANLQLDLTDSIEQTIKKLEEEAKVCALDTDMWVENARAKQLAGETVTANEQELIDLYAQKSALDGVLDSLDKLGSSNFSLSSSSSSSSSSDETPWWETELDRLKEMFNYNEITMQEYINGIENVKSKLAEGSDEWREVNDLLQGLKLDQIEDVYDRGIISIDEYIQRLKDLQVQYKRSTEAWNELADSIKEALEDKADMQKDDYDTAYNAALGLIDEEIDKLNELRDAEEERYDQLIADKEKANEETERELELARLQENLANAQNEKNKRVWKEGLGWTYEADQQAIDDAQQELDDFELESDILDIEAEKEAALADIDDLIDKWDVYKEQWESVVDNYETEQERLILSQELGAEAENDILNRRLETLQKFSDEYIKTMEQIKYLENTSADEVSDGISSSTPTSTAASSTSSQSASQTYTIKSGDTLSGIASKYGTTWQKIFDANRDVISNANKIYPGQTITIPGFSKGGVVDFTGLAMLHGTPGKPEYVLNNDQMKNMIASFNRPQTKSLNQTGGDSVNNYNFGNIELPNVKNAQQFITELKSLVNITKNQ